MFKFDFEVDDTGIAHPQLEQTSPEVVQLEPFAELRLSQLLDALPSLISYSPLPISLSSSREQVTFARRDLFDARFQLISDAEGPGDGAQPPSQTETGAPNSALAFLDAPSDLVPGVYEGGLKTWECSLDLVNYLDGLSGASPSYFWGKRILEVGCGTGIPSMYVLHRLFSGGSSAGTHIHLQDYNASVLELITLPNIILAWYMSPSSAEYRATATDPAECPPADPTVPGELPLTPALKSAFTASLTKHNISLAFSAGPWESLTAHFRSGLGVEHAAHDIVLTSETIYRIDALPALIELLHQAQASASPAQPVCLIAAKVMYFGVGGGVSEFMSILESKGMVDKGCAGKAETVWEHSVGVGRKILRIEWA